MQVKSFMYNMILSELEDAVGVENVSTSEVERASYTNCILQFREDHIVHKGFDLHCYSSL